MIIYVMHLVLSYAVLNGLGWILDFIGLIDLWDLQTQLVLLGMAAVFALWSKVMGE